jgi:hypothetical protein
MKPRGTREYVRHNKEFILLNRYLKLISKKLKKQKGGGLFDSCFGSSCVKKSNKTTAKAPQTTFLADLVFEPPVSISANAPTVHILTGNVPKSNDIGWQEFDYKMHDAYTLYVRRRLSRINDQHRERNAAIRDDAAIRGVKGDFENDDILNKLKADYKAYDEDSTVQYAMYWRRFNDNIEYGYVPINKFFGPMNVKVYNEDLYEKCYWIYYKARYNDYPTWRLFIKLEPDEATDPELKCDDDRKCMYHIPSNLSGSSREILLLQDKFINEYLDDIINLSKEKYPFFNEYIQDKKNKFNKIVASMISGR